MSRAKTYLSTLTLLALLAGMILSVLSWLETCTEACAESHKYHIFGFSFGLLGIGFFVAAIISFALSFYMDAFKWITAFLLAAGLGGEIMFVFVQKFVIGNWCPVCLGVTASVFTAVATFFGEFISNNSKKRLKQVLGSFSALVIGFVIAFFGIAKEDQLGAAENVLEKRLVLGNKSSPVEVYIFTSWVCPACKRLEPTLEGFVPDLLKQAKVIFVDAGEDLTSLNFVPFNLSFIENNSSQYVELRHMLKRVAEETDTPTEDIVEKNAAKLGIKYHPVNFADAAVATQYYRDMLTKFQVTALPCVVIYNPETKKEMRFSGSEVTAKTVLGAVKTLGQKVTAEAAK